MSEEGRIMNARVDFYSTDFNELVKAKGMRVMWEQAVVCQCITRDTGQPDFSCPLCKGSGYRYLPGKEIRVVSSAFGSSNKLESLGMREPGTAYATPTLDVIMGYKDRLKFIDFECKYSETLRFHKNSNLSDMTYRDIRSVLYILKDNSVYEEGVDFQIHPNRYQIQWVNPDTKSQEFVDMSILYLTEPSYLVVDLLHELRATYTKFYRPNEKFQELPKQYQLHREDFVYDVSVNNDGIQQPDPNIDEPKPSVATDPYEY